MYKLLLCLRYLRTRYIAMASIISVMLGVATMIVVNSVMAGFSTEMKDRIHGILADVVVESRSMSGIYGPDELQQKIREACGDMVVSTTPVVEVPGLVSFTLAGEPYHTPVQLVGIDPQGKSLMGPMKEYLMSYQAVTKDGKVIKPALRSFDEPSSFELTKEAADYRRMKTLRNQAFLQQEGLLKQTASVPQPTTASPTPQSWRRDRRRQVRSSTSTGIEQTAGTDRRDQLQQRVIRRRVFDDESRPGDPAIRRPASGIRICRLPRRTRNPEEPFDARIFIGSALISVPIQNHETGETEVRYMMHPGDDVMISTVGGGLDAQRLNATITDIFKSGMSEYDSSLVFMNIRELQKLRGMIRNQKYDENNNIIDADYAVTSIQLKLADYERDHEEVVKRLKAAFPPDKVAVRTWEAKQGPLLEAVEVEAAILNVLLFLIIAVAGFGILAIFYMIVVEKTRDIGILKALGASSKGVMSIFLTYGLALGVVGSTVGVVFGLLFVHFINEIEDGISWMTGQKVFDENIYYFSEIPTRVSPMMVVWVAVGAIAIATIASILPARRASRLCPVESLRYE